MSEGQKSRRRSGLGGAALVMFAGLAPAGAACGLAGDETAFVGSCAFRDYGEDQRAELCTWPASDHQHDPGQRRTSVHHTAPAVRTPRRLRPPTTRPAKTSGMLARTRPSQAL